MQAFEMMSFRRGATLKSFRGSRPVLSERTRRYIRENSRNLPSCRMTTWHNHQKGLELSVMAQ
eukprot:2672478-Rhodomonas_salina.3